jgi:transcriptional regulator of heat shock response
MADNTITVDFIDHILNKNLNAAENALNQSLASKQNDVLDQEKIKLANQIFNKVEPEDQEVEISDDELENIVADDEEQSEEEEIDNDESSEDEEDE